MQLQSNIPSLGDRRLPCRFWSKIRVTPNGCWEWLGDKNLWGYGRFAVRHQVLVQPHRLAYETLVGPIPPSLESDHLCRNHACANPAHIELVAHRVNVLRGAATTVNRSLQLAKTHCPAGHPYDEINTYHYHGKRHCRTCRLATKRRLTETRR